MPKVELNLEDDELKELLLGDRDKAIQSIMAKILDEILKSEATEQIKAKAYERSDERTNSRNGYRVRQLTTRVGTLELHVPKLRHGNFSTQLFKRYQRSEQAFDLALMEMVIQGVSTRKVAEITKKLCGTTFSKSTVSALCNNLDDQVLDFNTVHLFVTVSRTVCNPVYSLRLCHKGVVWRGELGSPPSIQKVIWIHYDFQIEFELEFIF